MSITRVSDDLQVPQIPGVLQAIADQINASYIVERWFSITLGTLVVAANAGTVIPVVVDTHAIPSLVSVMVAVKTAPVGSNIIVDVNKNGVTIFTTQANRPTINAGQNVSLARTPDVLSITSGDLLSVDVDAVGTTVAGSDLTVVVLVKQGLIVI